MREGEEGGPRMPLSAHLEELRKRLVRCLIAVGIFFGLAFWRTNDVMAFLRRPLDLVQAKYGLDRVDVVQLKIYGGFMASMKIAFLVGCILAAPVIVYQIWGFIGAGLYPKERRTVKFYFIPGLLLFLGGAALSYFWIMPHAIDFLVWWSVVKMGIKSTLNIGNYVSLIAFAMMAFGLIFQMPLVMIFVMRIGLVSPEFFRRYRKHAIVVAFFLGMILTPPDVLSQLILAPCLIVLYEGAILVGSRVARPRKEAPS